MSAFAAAAGVAAAQRFASLRRAAGASRCSACRPDTGVGEPPRRLRRPPATALSGASTRSAGCDRRIVRSSSTRHRNQFVATIMALFGVPQAGSRRRRRGRLRAALAASTPWPTRSPCATRRASACCCARTAASTPACRRRALRAATQGRFGPTGDNRQHRGAAARGSLQAGEIVAGDDTGARWPALRGRGPPGGRGSRQAAAAAVAHRPRKLATPGRRVAMLGRDDELQARFGAAGCAGVGGSARFCRDPAASPASASRGCSPNW